MRRFERMASQIEFQTWITLRNEPVKLEGKGLSSSDLRRCGGMGMLEDIPQ